MPAEAGKAGKVPHDDPHMESPERKPPRLAERKTELKGSAIAPQRKERRAVRRQTEQDIFGPDPEIPYVRFERALRDIVCSLMERQDRMNEEIFRTINDHGYRLDDVEADVQDLKYGRHD